MPEPEISVRRATVVDAEALSRFSAEVFPLGCPANTSPDDLANYISEELTPERFCALLQDNRVVILVAETQREIAAYTLLARGVCHSQVQCPNQSELRKFYVRAKFHGRGVADVLMAELLALAANDGTLWLSVFSENRRAISFYERWGFRVIGTQDFLVGADYQKDYVMQREAKLSAREASQ